MKTPVAIQCLCLAVFAPTPSSAMSLEEAGVALGDENFKVREQADEVIRKARMQDYDRVLRLARSDDPEVATRARKSLPVILLDIDDRVPPELAAKLRHFDRLGDGELLQLVTEVATLSPPRPTILIGLHSHCQSRAPLNPEARQEITTTLERSITATLNPPAGQEVLDQMRPERYPQPTLAWLLNESARIQGQDLTPLVPLYDRWKASHPQLPAVLNEHGYRLELCLASSQLTGRAEALRRFLQLATQTPLSKAQEAAVRRQLAEYRDEAVHYPVDSMDESTGWYFFGVLGSNQTDHDLLDSYRRFRKRFPAPPESVILGQPLEVLLVLERSGAPAAFAYALKQTHHGGVMLLAEWLRAHPELIREPLPLPEVKKGQPYPYRPVKFIRIFAPFADDAAMRREPRIAAAFAILTQDPGWQEVAKQARAIIGAN